MKLKQLEGLLGGLTQFSDPKVLLTAPPPPPPPLGWPFFLPFSYPARFRLAQPRQKGGGKAEEYLTFATNGVFFYNEMALLGVAGAGAVCDGPSHRVADALHGVSFFCWDSLGKRRRAFSHVLGIDIDPQSLELAQENAADLEV
ncbi:hypothetical protein ZEAMMB73_Zm00001d036278 [Zea mays]|uniref:S-adenosyl-L-methionine-dependent methyltransferase superfamily protein n=1 Tax=Zea mays TaxID=4577 RepID=A0A1D6LLF9_MAIZE|nr:hypothetical protein ZEAMMB73_Zm00001d036278 [Zea mays]